MKMAAALPDHKSRRNGLDDLARMLVDNPDQPLVCVVVLDCSKTEIDHDKATKTPTVRVKHLEPMLRVEDQDRAVTLLTDAYKRRTSEQLELDYEFEPIGRDAPNYFPAV
jgi:hypothetical protein